MLQRRPEQRPGLGEPAGLARRLVQREQGLGEGGVVLEHRGGVADLAVARSPAQPPVDDVGAQQERDGAPGGGQPLAAPEGRRRLDQRGDGQRVPPGHDLVVALGLRTAARAPSRVLRTGSTPRVVGVDGHPQRGAAVLEGPAGGDAEQLRGPSPVFGPQHLASSAGVQT